jgi:nuclear RNA export factor
MSQDTTTVLLACLGQRYDVNTKSLDLSSMYHDPSLKENGVRGCMYNKEFVSSILELVGANCPELLSLDLSSNRLQHLDAYSTLTSVCPSLQSINLSDNELHSPSELEKLAGMASLTKLAVEGNPFTQGGSDLMSLANTLRKIFPNIQTLDGQDLPSPAKFDLPTSVGQLPPTQKGFVVNDQIQTLVVEFVQQYYSLYDGENRDKLFEAYSEDAVFSLSVNGTRRGPPMDMYMPFSHNLARLKDPGKRQPLVKHGRIDIVQCLRSLPRSKNHLSAFNVDVMRATQNSTAFVIYGFFSEVGGSRIDNVPVRAFTRTFVLTAVGSG